MWFDRMHAILKNIRETNASIAKNNHCNYKTRISKTSSQQR